jgi:hypothetical protein
LIESVSTAKVCYSTAFRNSYLQAHPRLADVHVLLLNNDPHIPHVSLHDASLQADHVPPAGQATVVVVVTGAVEAVVQTYVLFTSVLVYGEQQSALGKMQTGAPHVSVSLDAPLKFLQF